MHANKQFHNILHRSDFVEHHLRYEWVRIKIENVSRNISKAKHINKLIFLGYRNHFQDLVRAIKGSQTVEIFMWDADVWYSMNLETII